MPSLPVNTAKSVIQFVAREGFRLTLGNAGGVRVTVDGRALEPLGSSGQVVRDLRVPPPLDPLNEVVKTTTRKKDVAAKAIDRPKTI